MFMKEQLKIRHFMYIVYCTTTAVCNMVICPIILILLLVPVRIAAMHSMLTLSSGNCLLCADTEVV